MGLTSCGGRISAGWPKGKAAAGVFSFPKAERKRARAPRGAHNTTESYRIVQNPGYGPIFLPQEGPVAIGQGDLCGEY